MVPLAISLTSSICQFQADRCKKYGKGDNHPDHKTRQGQQHRQELVSHQSTKPSGQNAEKNSCCPKYGQASFFSLLNMAFSRSARHALNCRRSPPTLLRALALADQCSDTAALSGRHCVRTLTGTRFCTDNCHWLS